MHVANYPATFFFIIPPFKISLVAVAICISMFLIRWMAKITLRFFPSVKAENF
jgi:hypothetical protein